MPRSKHLLTSKCLQILDFLSLHHNGLSRKQLLGEHTFPVTSCDLPDMASPDRAKWLLDKSTFPALDVEVTYVKRCFPRQTLDRVLKKLVKDGVVEKVREPRKQGERGRPSWRYRIRHWHRWGCMYLRLPASRPAGRKDPRWFLGKKIGESVRKWPEEKARFDKLLVEDQEFARAVQKTQRDRRKLLRKQRKPKLPSTWTLEKDLD